MKRRAALGFTLGSGTYQHGQWGPAPDPAAKAGILTAQRALFQRMAALQAERPA